MAATLIAMCLAVSRQLYQALTPPSRKKTRAVNRIFQETDILAIDMFYNLLQMISTLIVILCGVSPVIAAEPTTDPLLRVETVMHTGFVKNIAVDGSHGRVLTVSDDKTARVWDLQTGRLLQTMRVPAASGFEGRLYAVAVSPDGETAALAGWTGWDWDSSASIYLFQMSSGLLLDRIAGLPNVVDSLAYSHDGHYLAAGLAEGYGIRIYDTRTHALVGADSRYGERVTGLDFDRNGRLAAAALDGAVRLYDRDHRLVSKKVTAEGRQPKDIRFSPDARELAVGFFDTPRVVILSTEDLATLHLPDTRGLTDQKNLLAVEWSESGDYLYAGGDYSGEGKTPIYRWHRRGRGSRREIPVATSMIAAIERAPEGAVAYGTGEPSIGVLERDGKRWVNKPEIADYRDDHSSFRVSYDGATTCFSYVRSDIDAACFSITAKSLTQPPPADQPLFEPLLHSEGVSITGWKDLYLPKLNGKDLGLVPLELSRAYAISHNRHHVLLGTEWSLRLYDMAGKQRWMVPTPDDVWVVNVSGDSQWALAGLADGSIRWYRMEDGKEILALFPHANRTDWIAWTPEGYYVSSPHGDRYIGWHVNRGKDREPDYFCALQFERVLYRPDYVAEYFEARGDERRLETVGSRPQVGMERLLQITPPRIRIDGPALYKEVARGGEVMLKFFAELTSEHPMRDFVVYVNEIPVVPYSLRQLKQGEQTAFAKELRIPLFARENRIRVEVANGVSMGIAEIMIDSPEFVRRAKYGDLYVLAIGVNRFDAFPANSQNQLLYAAQDAVAFAEHFSMTGKTYFRRVFTKLVTDFSQDSPTRTGILKALDFLQQADANDTVILFLASHGLSDKAGNYYLIPKDASAADIRALSSGRVVTAPTLVSWKAFFEALRRSAGRRLVVVDTCYAQKIEGTFDFHSLAKRSATSSFAVVSASQGNESSQNYPPGEHGLFTYALLEGLAGAADPDGDKYVTLAELYKFSSRFVAKKHNKTMGPQTPALAAPKGLERMVLAHL